MERYEERRSSDFRRGGRGSERRYGSSHGEIGGPRSYDRPSDVYDEDDNSSRGYSRGQRMRDDYEDESMYQNRDRDDFGSRGGYGGERGDYQGDSGRRRFSSSQGDYGRSYGHRQQRSSQGFGQSMSEGGSFSGDNQYGNEFSSGGRLSSGSRSFRSGSEQGENFRGRGPKGYSRSDERIREDVCERLSDNSGIDASEIEVQVSDGEVTLSGTVEERRIKRMAEDIVEDISGVKDVQNQIKVQKQSNGSDSMQSSESGKEGKSRDKSSQKSMTH